MIRPTLLLLILLLTGSGRPLSGQTLWNLHDCMVYAVENAPKHKIQELTNQNNNKDLRDARLGFLPSISGGTSGSYSFGQATDRGTNQYISNTVQFLNNYSLNASVPMFNGFQAINKLKVAKVARLQGIEEAQRIADEISLTTLQSYFNVVHAHGLVSLAREQLDESRRRLKNTRTMEELGLKGQADVLQIEAEVATKDFNLTQQENVLAENVLQLKEAMFFPIDATLQIDTATRWEINLLGERESRDSIFKTAVNYLPKSKIAELNVASAQSRFKSAKWQLLPSLSLSGGYSTGYAHLNTAKENLRFNQQFNGNQNKSVGLSLSVPIFGGLVRQSNITRTRNAMKIAEYEQDQTLQQIEAAIQRAIQEMEGKGKEYVQAVKTVMAEQAAYEVNKRKYEEGLLSILDLQTSSNRLLEANVKQLNTLLGYQIKRREVTYYKGTPYINQAF